MIDRVTIESLKKAIPALGKLHAELTDELKRCPMKEGPIVPCISINYEELKQALDALWHFPPMIEIHDNAIRGVLPEPSPSGYHTLQVKG